MKDDLKIAVDIMAQYIGSRDAKRYTKETLMKSYGFDEPIAEDLTKNAWKEWVEAYSG
jgi:hypothetical protein